MQIRKSIPAAFLLGAVLLTTACGSDSKPNFISAKADQNTEVANTLNAFYDVVEQKYNVDAMGDNQEEVQAAEDADKASIMSKAPGMEYFDTSTPEITEDSYLLLADTVDSFEMARGRYQGEKNLRDVNVEISQDAVTVDGSTAKVNLATTKVSINGKLVETDSARKDASTVVLIKNSEGKWVISPKFTKGGLTG